LTFSPAASVFLSVFSMSAGGVHGADARDRRVKEGRVRSSAY
jgi:hypothetical protein